MFRYLFIIFILINASSGAEWGFFAHKKINRLAVFTLPPEMAGFYKKHIDFIEQHAVDPDKRRYAVTGEAVKHFIDLDQWLNDSVRLLPTDIGEAILEYSKLVCVGKNRDTLLTGDHKTLSLVWPDSEYVVIRKMLKDSIKARCNRNEFQNNSTTIDMAAGTPLIKGKVCQSIVVIDEFTQHGVVPYVLIRMKQRLTKAFSERDERLILKYSAEIGHYIGDAHVPLHTSKNYNGQLSGQHGIHAFWESRLPELFADSQYDFWVGKAVYIEDWNKMAWDIVYKSHGYLDSVLAIEKDLRNIFPEDRQYCYENRLGQVVRTQCEEFSKAYHDRMAGMVEERMRQAIITTGSVWFTAWVDAGQPDLQDLEAGPAVNAADSLEFIQLDNAYKLGKGYGRDHE